MPGDQESFAPTDYPFSQGMYHLRQSGGMTASRFAYPPPAPVQYDAAGSQQNPATHQPLHPQHVTQLQPALQQLQLPQPAQQHQPPPPAAQQPQQPQPAAQQSLLPQSATAAPAQPLLNAAVLSQIQTLFQSLNQQSTQP